MSLAGLSAMQILFDHALTNVNNAQTHQDRALFAGSAEVVMVMWVTTTSGAHNLIVHVRNNNNGNIYQRNIVFSNTAPILDLASDSAVKNATSFASNNVHTFTPVETLFAGHNQPPTSTVTLL